jgi:hypothetical protein
MKFLLTSLFMIVFSVAVSAQTSDVSKLILKNGDVITGKIIEMKPGEFIKIQIVGNNILDIPYGDVQEIILDASKAQEKPKAENNQSQVNYAETVSRQDIKPLKDFYFETHHEFAFGLGAGKVYGYPYENITGQIVNDDVFAGYYTTNGVGYKNMLFAGIGFGFYGHSGFGDNNDQKTGYSVPFMLDLRYRVLPNAKFSPLVMVAPGMSYYEGSLGAFSFMDAIGVSIKFSNRLNAHLLFAHNYERYSSSLSVNNSILEDFYTGIYLNYIGARIGISYKI